MFQVMTYRHPVSFLLGLEGVALLRAHAGDDGLDQAFVERRVAEIETLLLAHRRGEFGDGRFAVPITTVDGYERWSTTYDTEHNPLIEVEEPIVQAILAALPPGRAVDAACGTGRHATFLASAGHQVTGIDSSSHMLTLARQRLPQASFHDGRIEELPLADGSADLVVCGLALAHASDLRPVFAEFARVLAAGGHLVTSDIHFLSLYLGGVASAEIGDGTLGLMPASRWKASDYLRAAMAAGFRVRDCVEPGWRPSETAGGPLARQWCPDASDAVHSAVPAAIVWHFQKT